MFEGIENLDFADSALAVGGVLEGADLLDGHLLARPFVEGLPTVRKGRKEGRMETRRIRKHPTERDMREAKGARSQPPAVQEGTKKHERLGDIQTGRVVREARSRPPAEQRDTV